MEHRLVANICKALGWDGPGLLGSAFARGQLPDDGLREALMSPARLLEIIKTRHLENPQLRFYADGNELHPSAYLSTATNRRRQSVRRADMASVGAILNGGGTLVLDSLDTFDPTMEVACRALGWWSGELVSVNTYLAVGDTAGFHLHWDDHDVLAVQLAGEKSWEVRTASRPAPMYRDAEQNLEPSEEVVWAGTMHAGDVMHIPRGWWHTATRVGSGEGLSLHCTFGITRRTGVTWLNWLSDAAREHVRFRTDLEGPDAPGAKELATRVLDLACGIPPTAYLAQLRETAPPARHTPWVRAFGPVAAVVAVTEYAPTIEATDSFVEVRAGGKRISLALKAEPWVRTLLSGHPVDLADADPAAIQLAERLIEEGLCAPLTPNTDGSFSGYTGMLPTMSFLRRRSAAA